MPGDTHTRKDLEYIKDMISGLSLQIAGVAISNIYKLSETAELL